jgi:hypothetical protein
MEAMKEDDIYRYSGHMHNLNKLNKHKWNKS